MAQPYKQIKIVDQIIKRMEKYNLAEATVGNIHLKKEKPQDVADRGQLREITEARRAAAAAIPDSYFLETTKLPAAEISA